MSHGLVHRWSASRLGWPGAVALVAVACSGSTTYGKKRPDSDYLRRRLVALEGNVKAFASELGISRNTLYRWLREEGIDPAELR